MYVLLSTLNTKLLRFEYVKNLYIQDDFSQIYVACEYLAFDKFYRVDEYLFKENISRVPNCSMRELLVREAHGGRLMEHLGVAKTLNVLHEHFYCPKMKKDVKRTCN